MAAQELKNALEAQMQAKMMLEDDGAAQINGESSQLTDHIGTGSLMEYSASNLVCDLVTCRWCHSQNLLQCAWRIRCISETICSRAQAVLAQD